MKFIPNLKTVSLKAFSYVSLCFAAVVSMLPASLYAQEATPPTVETMMTEIDVFATLNLFTTRLAPVYKWGISVALVSILIWLVIKFARRSA